MCLSISINLCLEFKNSFLSCFLIKYIKKLSFYYTQTLSDTYILCMLIIDEFTTY